MLLAKVQADVRVYNLACWAEAVVGRDAASITSNKVGIAYAAQDLLLSPFKYEPSVNHECYSEEFPVDHHEESGGDLSILSSCEDLHW